MSAEAPKNTGITAPNTQQEPQGCLPGFLRRLFATPQEVQQIPKIIQPPSGLEGFADQLQQGIDGYFASVRQQDLERRNAEAARMANKALEKIKTEQLQRDRLEQEQSRIRAAVTEASKTLQDFQIAERLRYIQDKIWGGKGNIAAAEPAFNIDGRYNRLGGLRLEYECPYYYRTVTEEWSDAKNYASRKYERRWKYASATFGTCLSVDVLACRQDSQVEARKLLEVSAIYDYTFRVGVGRFPFGGDTFLGKVTIPIDQPDSKTLLGGALTQETVHRVAIGWIPSKLDEQALEERSRLPHWEKWIYVPPVYSGGD
ncbi:MAG: hypothetical protein PHV63_01335 [Candidatus Daviesbacteria bacterium]|nr:hypothetical protein [Candidatus Daviesbacteria bacterium]